MRNKEDNPGKIYYASEYDSSGSTCGVLVGGILVAVTLFAVPWLTYILGMSGR